PADEGYPPRHRSANQLFDGLIWGGAKTLVRRRRQTRFDNSRQPRVFFNLLPRNPLFFWVVQPSQTLGNVRGVLFAQQVRLVPQTIKILARNNHVFPTSDLQGG